MTLLLQEKGKERKKGKEGEEEEGQRARRERKREGEGEGESQEGGVCIVVSVVLHSVTVCFEGARTADSSCYCVYDQAKRDLRHRPCRKHVLQLALRHHVSRHV